MQNVLLYAYLISKVEYNFGPLPLLGLCRDHLQINNYDTQIIVYPNNHNLELRNIEAHHLSSRPSTVFPGIYLQLISERYKLCITVPAFTLHRVIMIPPSSFLWIFMTSFNIKRVVRRSLLFLSRS